MDLCAGIMVALLLYYVTDRRITITAALLAGKTAMHTEKAGETLLHNAHVAIPNRQYSTDGQLHDLECSHLNR